jgi:hydroxyacylglutathione hydrolase
MRVVPVACLKDNYAYLVVSETTGEAAVVDPSEAAPVLTAIEREKVKLAAIWCTHHHWDHVGGNEEIAKRFGVDVWAHVSDEGRVPAQTKKVDTGDRFSLGDLSVHTIHIPGHTTGAVAYVVDDCAVFTGDTMFLAGCGRLFEGTPAMMHASLGRIATLPGATLVYCGHEYTESNLCFAAHVEPSNANVARAREAAAEKRAKGEPTVPGTLDEEKRNNPFLRVRSEAIRKTLGIPADADDVTAFAAIRAAKDSFR